MSSSQAASNQMDTAGVVTPRRLELSLDPENGSLLTAPLSTVLLAATDGLYTDLYQMAHGELDVAHAGEPDETAAEAAATPAGTSKESMSNLSFAQRRHELAWRLAQHGKGLAQVCALTAASAISPSFSQSTRVSTRALQHARTAWVQADEAQDALYFFHAQLFPARQAPHDVHGALDLLKRGNWRDLPTDLQLEMDRYHSMSAEAKWPAKKVAEQWHMAVRHKLLQGEVAYRKDQLFHLKLQGGILTLTHGSPKMVGSRQKWPVEAQLSVFSNTAEWTLLSIQVVAMAKTGESNHQLDTTNRQQFDLHRLCVLAMAKEEARAKQEQSRDDMSDSETCMARPLQSLFQVAHSFQLSWQLEILSAQAQALKRGVWATSTDSTLVVTPVTFMEPGTSPILGVLSISFWNVDDRNGPPRVGDLKANDSNNDSTRLLNDKVVTNKLTLFIWAESVGIRVSLSGGDAIREAAKTDAKVEQNVQKLLEAASDPFALSASDALLAATSFCGELKCRAIVQALQPDDTTTILPSWISLQVERSSIAVTCRLGHSHKRVVLFRLECDARMGTFVVTFPRSMELLRLLSANDVSASNALALRLALHHRRKGAVAATATGRFVRDAMDGLVRSMNLLGQRTGVGGEWQDINDRSASLRQRAIQLACADVKVSLVTCCGVAAVYGLSSMALGVATGVTALADLTGKPLEAANGKQLLAAPPVSVIMDQRMIQKVILSNDGDKKKLTLLEKDVFAVSCTVSDDEVTLCAFDVTIQMESPTSMPTVLQVSPLPLQSAEKSETSNGEERPSKRSRIECNGDSRSQVGDLMDEVGTWADIFAASLKL